MRKLIVTEWVSLDGVFDANLMDKWYHPYHSDSRGASIRDAIDNCDVMLYGRRTYEMLYPYWSTLKNNEMGVAAKLNAVKKYVVSNTLKEAPWAPTEIIRQDPMQAIADIKAQNGGHILVQGSATLVRALLEAKLVDELKLMIHPHIAGTGKRLFEDAPSVGLECISIEQLDRGVMVACYKPLK